MSTFYDAALSLLAGKKIEKSEADRIIELIRSHTMRPELKQLDALRSRVEDAMSEFESVQSAINSLSYDFNQLDRDTDSAMTELEGVREALEELSTSLENE